MKMKTSKMVRPLVAAGCVAGAVGCVGGPQPRPPPPPEECPPGAEAVLNSFGVYPGDIHGATLIPLGERPRILAVRDGQKVRAEIAGAWERLPYGTNFEGRLYLGHERVYGRFTSAHLPSGETLPVCLEVMTLGERARGTEVWPGSTASQALTISTVSIQAVTRFK